MTRHKVILAPAASDDVMELIEYLATSAGLEVAMSANARLDTALVSLEQYATRGRIVPELRERGVSAYRELVETPYRIVYRVEQREVWVVAVVDHRRDLDVLLTARARRR